MLSSVRPRSLTLFTCSIGSRLHMLPKGKCPERKEKSKLLLGHNHRCIHKITSKQAQWTPRIYRYLPTPETKLPSPPPCVITEGYVSIGCRAPLTPGDKRPSGHHRLCARYNNNVLAASGGSSYLPMRIKGGNILKSPKETSEATLGLPS